MTIVLMKPAIHFYVDQFQDTSITNQILFGIEEEGIPVQITDMDVENVIHAAYTAATISPLLVGVALKDNQFVIHYRNLQPEQPLFYEQMLQNKCAYQVRDFGANAARLVKGIPFK